MAYAYREFRPFRHYHHESGKDFVAVTVGKRDKMEYEYFFDKAGITEAVIHLPSRQMMLPGGPTAVHFKFDSAGKVEKLAVEVAGGEQPVELEMDEKGEVVTAANMGKLPKMSLEQIAEMKVEAEDPAVHAMVRRLAGLEREEFPKPI